MDSGGKECRRSRLRGVLCDEGPESHGSVQSRFAEQHNPLLCSLGFIHCPIGIFEKDVSRFSVSWVYGNTNTGGCGKNSPIKLERLGNLINHLLCKAKHVGFLPDIPTIDLPCPFFMILPDVWESARFMSFYVALGIFPFSNLFLPSRR